MVKPSREDIFKILETVLDPEVPVLNVVELGIIRDATVIDANSVHVDITPTYSGCPAMAVITKEIEDALHARGFSQVKITTSFSPPWTTDWMSAEAKEKLRIYGIAPPGAREEPALVTLGPRKKIPVPCPFCGSNKTELRSEFGGTACKGLYFCSECRQPFEYFKAI